MNPIYLGDSIWYFLNGFPFVAFINPPLVLTKWQRLLFKKWCLGPMISPLNCGKMLGNSLIEAFMPFQQLNQR